MSHLNDIIEAVRKKGWCEVHWNSLVGAYFRGDDPDREIKSWANKNGMTLQFDDIENTCVFKG